MKYLIILLAMFYCTNAVCQEIQAYSIPVVEVPQTPQYTLSTYNISVYRPMVYQWVPYVVHQPVLVEKYGLFQHRTTITYRPSIYWVYQLSYINP